MENPRQVQDNMLVASQVVSVIHLESIRSENPAVVTSNCSCCGNSKCFGKTGNPAENFAFLAIRMVHLYVTFLLNGNRTQPKPKSMLVWEHSGTELVFWTPYTAAFHMPKYFHLFVISWTQPQHCSVGSAAGDPLLWNRDLSCPSFSNSGTGTLANTKAILVTRFPTTTFSQGGEGERSWCHVSPWPMKDKVTSTVQCPHYPHVLYVMFRDLLVRISTQQNKGTDM